MRQMIDDLELTGRPPQTRHEPGAFMIQGDMVVHPSIEEQLIRQAALRTAKVFDDHMFRSAIAGFTGGGPIHTKGRFV